MEIMEKYKWHFPPTTNKQGISHYKHDIKDVIITNTTLFRDPTIIMSDIHGNTPKLVKILDEHINLGEFIVLTAGDMAGENIFGSDGNPTPEYEFLNEKSKEFYFVQGNHDLPDDNNRQDVIKNNQNKFASIKDGKSVKTNIGKIGAINGIISNKQHRYKMSQSRYLKYLKEVLNSDVDILVTHDTPSIPIFDNNGNRYVGNEEMFKIINQYKPKIHIYGHCHHPNFYNQINGTHYINADARVIVCFPNDLELNTDKYFRLPMMDLYTLD